MGVRSDPDPRPEEPDHPGGAAQPSAADFFPGVTPAESQTLDRETCRIEERRLRVMALYRSGLGMAAIAERSGCSLATCYRDVQAVLEGYRRIAARSAAEHLADALQRLNHRELDIQGEWEKSKGESVEAHTSRRTANGGQTDHATVKKRQRYGDPRLAALLMGCWDRRCKLLGLLVAGGDGAEKAGPRAGGADAGGAAGRIEFTASLGAALAACEDPAGDPPPAPGAGPGRPPVDPEPRPPG